jgi:hypothetical protein
MASKRRSSEANKTAADEILLPSRNQWRPEVFLVETKTRLVARSGYYP